MAALFFKRAVVGEYVLDAILSFFYSGSLLREVHNTIIAKVPKIPNATKLSNYRLISCCNTIKKCLTKLIANRVEVVLGEHHKQPLFLAEV